MTGFLAGLLVAVLPLLAAGFWLGRRTARPESLGGLGTPVEHATFETLHTASLAAPPLRAGLTEETARRSARRLRTLLGTDALCLTDHERLLVWDGVATTTAPRSPNASWDRWSPAAARPSACTASIPTAPSAGRWSRPSPSTTACTAP